MFKSSRKKIVLSIMAILTLLWAGTLGVIYASSYWEMEQQNEQMLKTHAQQYTLPPSVGELHPEWPLPGGSHGNRPFFDPESPKFQLSIFYTVAVSSEGDVLEIKNESPTVYSDAALTELAQHIIQESKESGIRDNLAFYKADKGGYTLVAFMDNTIVNENAMMLFRYTLIFGGIALLAFFFLARFLAKKIIDPLEKSYLKQKQFISDAGHELKTPVSVVSANAELLARELGDNQWLQNIQYENERMGMLVGQLLDLARTEAVMPQTEYIDLSRLVAGEALPFESIAFEKDLVLITDIDDGIAAEGNSAQLKQLTAILLDNAIRHTHAAGEVHLVLKKEHNMAVVSVTNPGDEIPPEHREQIFERFYRIDPARNGEDKHYGLGLAIAKAIVTAHHGHIQVHCYNGLVEFRATLPVAKEK